MTSMNRVHIIGAGGNAGVLLTRCLNWETLDWAITGEDSSPWARQLMECPLTLENTAPDMIWPVPDSAVAKYSGNPLCFLPDPRVIALCQNKSACQLQLKELAPKRYWERDVYGAGGAGAKMISEYLPGRNYSVELVYNNGELMAQFSKERLAYDLKGSQEPTHQRGTSLVSVCIKDETLLRLAIKAVRAVNDYYAVDAHGIYGVDFKENEQGEPKITEINAGRFLTASYVYFQQYNLPRLVTKLFFGEEVTPLGDYPEGKMAIRQFDSLPRLIHKSEVK
jgi:hypothetical protein